MCSGGAAEIARIFGHAYRSLTSLLCFCVCLTSSSSSSLPPSPAPNPRPPLSLPSPAAHVFSMRRGVQIIGMTQNLEVVGMQQHLQRIARSPAGMASYTLSSHPSSSTVSAPCAEEASFAACGMKGELVVIGMTRGRGGVVGTAGMGRVGQGLSARTILGGGGGVISVSPLRRECVKCFFFVSTMNKHNMDTTRHAKRVL